MKVEKEKRKEVQAKRIKEMQRQAEERNRKEVEALKEADKLAAYTLVVKETQRKSREACETEAETLSKVNRDNRTVEDLIKLG